jgi:hypothetical protein
LFKLALLGPSHASGNKILLIGFDPLQPNIIDRPIEPIPKVPKML